MRTPRTRTCYRKTAPPPTATTRRDERAARRAANAATVRHGIAAVAPVESDSDGFVGAPPSSPVDPQQRLIRRNTNVGDVRNGAHVSGRYTERNRNNESLAVGLVAWRARMRAEAEAGAAAEAEDAVWAGQERTAFADEMIVALPEADQLQHEQEEAGVSEDGDGDGASEEAEEAVHAPIVTDTTVFFVDDSDDGDDVQIISMTTTR